ncbi:hypothetical protein P7C73_g3345, partial [Tremellales sp. Uapishka_1]
MDEVGTRDAEDVLPPRDQPEHSTESPSIPMLALPIVTPSLDSRLIAQENRPDVLDDGTTPHYQKASASPPTTKRSSRQRLAAQPHRPTPRHSSMAPAAPLPPQPPQQPYSPPSNTLLNLPPPLPFHLQVSDLQIGIPDKVSFLPSWLHKKRKVDDGGQRKKWILKEVGCDCRSGEVLAILGGSGSGKTTLLNAVAYRLSGLPVENGAVSYYSASRGAAGVGEGEAEKTVVDLNEGMGRKLKKGEIGKRIGFVRQQDYLVECLTVRETLTYAARLRLPPSLSAETIRLIVEQTIDELGLRDAAETVVGGPLRKGISGGEKRRLSIGCVLVTLPSVLILDEPTSGLDAFTSYLLLQTLSQLARRGRTVILSIHAPRSDAFNLFDRIALLSKGEVVYSGLRENCLGWFSTLGQEVERGVNPLDFLIDISSIDNRSPEKEEESKDRVQSLVTSWKTRDPNTWATDLPLSKTISSTDSLHRQATIAPELNRIITGDHSIDTKRPGFFRQTRVLTARAHRNVYRNIPLLIGFMLQAIILGVIIGTPTGIQSLKNLSYQLIPGVFYLQQVFWIWKFCTDLVIFDREREDVIPYVLSDWLSFLIPSILAPTLYVILVYFIAYLNMDGLAAKLLTTIASTVTVQFAVQGAALLAASLLRSFAQASLLGNAVNLFQIMSAGFIVTNVPNYVKWIRWISPYFYSFRIVATLQFKDRVFDCPPDTSANLNQCIGNNVLHGLNFDLSINIGVWFAGMIGLAIVEYGLACFVLWIYAAGGVKHAAEIDSHNRGKSTDVVESHMTRDKINVAISHLSLSWERHGRGILREAKKTILNDLTISFPAGEVSAILSTLLQLLAGRKLNAGALAGFYRTGDILFAGQPANAAFLSNVAFVEQDDDWHLPSLTVRETLRYAAILRLPDKMARKQKIARAETVLLMLGLKDCADLPVGGSLLKGISGGEKRRLSLAVQMINDPAVLVVDEPTSGLDSSIALSVMQVLRDIAATGRTVIATIHQPRSDIWRLADNVTLLAKGGVVAFSGKRADAVDYFTSIGYPMPSEFFNPADHLLDLVSVDPREVKHQDSQSRVRNLTAGWEMVTAKAEAGEEHVRQPGQHISRGQGTTSMRVALPVVLQRHWRNLWRQKEIFFNRLVQTPLLGGMFILFFQRLSHGPSGAQDRIGITIESTSAIAFVGLLNAMAIFPADRNLYLHESKSSARYSPATFVIVYTIVELGFELLSAFGYAAIMNVAVGEQTSARIFFEFSMTIWALQNMGESLAMILGVWISTEGLTVTIVSTILSMAGQVSGVISLSVPRWLADIAWGMCLKPATRIQIINEAVGLKFNCSAAQLASGDCVAQSGEQLLALFGFEDLNTARYTGIMIAIAIAWRIVAWLSISAKVGGVR